MGPHVAEHSGDDYRPPQGQRGAAGWIEEVGPPRSFGPDARGIPGYPVDSHVRLASPEDNWGAKMLRRSFSYDNGTIDENGTSVSDAGTFFACYQRYPEVAFVLIFRKLAEEDALTPFTVHTASAIAAIPAAAAEPGDWIGRLLLDG